MPDDVPRSDHPTTHNVWEESPKSEYSQLSSASGSVPALPLDFAKKKQLGIWNSQNDFSNYSD